MSYIPNTDADRAKMLEAIGVSSVSDLFAPIPDAIKEQADFSGVDPALDDISLKKHLIALSSKNAHMDAFPCYLGAGIYDHYIPPIVGHVTGRSEFYTAYTPYQPEVSQGVLQSIYEFQTLICQLTGMDVANASMYDGATALAEAAIMACDITKRKRVLLASSVHPAFRRTVETYMPMLAESVDTFSFDEATGSVDRAALDSALTDQTACVVVQQPNFFGAIEDLQALADAAHAKGALLITVVDPISLGLLETPGACGVDIVVGEGQGLGCYPAFGGPLLGLFACRREYVRRIPGRIVGGTVDGEGTRAYTMTLRTREQDIRRETATSNICTNQALFALAATVYLAAMGKTGIGQVANLCVQKAHYAQKAVCALPGFEPLFSAPFFKEFAVRCPEDPAAINKRLLEAGIIGGLPLGKEYPGLENAMLLCVTEQRTKAEIDALVEALRGA
ncbi:MAG TPA: aminomethyl-transferring glycine dehydrogenase subunit GcvPA [Armatimonadaceae bacterium]|nr:aminomethyl-transferring glycine dehydrogenase subunit GcvPA [Armatimonadaceae bacterium]